MIPTADIAEIRARVSSRQKARAQRVLKEHGWNMSAFLRLMVNTVAESGQIPAVPNAAAARALREGLRGENLIRAGKSREEIRAALWG